MSKPRYVELHRRQRRRRKIEELRKRYSIAKSDTAHKNILAKLRKVAPTVNEETFIQSAQPYTNLEHKGHQSA